MIQLRPATLYLGCALLGILFLAMRPTCAQMPLSQNAPKRLILKDGSYQLASKYEVRDDRVHYFSAERNEWEDIPKELIDWDATNQYEKDRAAGKASPQVQALEEEIRAERNEEELKSPHVAAGLRLPSEGGVYALDTYMGLPQLLPLDQSSGEINRNTAHNVLRATINPVAGAKHTIELAGPSAKVQAHASLPSLYINIEGTGEDDTSSSPAAELPWDRFRIVRLQSKGDKRIVGSIKVAVYGKVSQGQDQIPATAEQLGEGWVKLTPNAPLDPGEYAVVEVLGRQGINSYVWDFGVHPAAPANLSVIKPDQSELKRQSGQPPPALEKR
jgi:hypothetical protein